MKRQFLVFSVLLTSLLAQCQLLAFGLCALEPAWQDLDFVPESAVSVCSLDPSDSRLDLTADVCEEKEESSEESLGPRSHTELFVDSPYVSVLEVTCGDSLTEFSHAFSGRAPPVLI